MRGFWQERIDYGRFAAQAAHSAGNRQSEADLPGDHETASRYVKQAREMFGSLRIADEAGEVKFMRKLNG